MINQSERQRVLQDWAQEMKRDWDDRARRNAKWFIDHAQRPHSKRLQPSDEEFDRLGKLEVERLILADLPLLTQGEDARHLRVLEIGCGIGRMTRELAGIFGEVHATDVSAEMIKQARARLQGLTNVRLYETNGLDFADLPSGHFDLVFSAYVFQHVPSVEIIRANLLDAYRLLKPGGVMKFQTNGITAFEFEEIEKDTWTGAAFPEAELRRFAEETGAQLIGIFGAGLQFCWTTLRKRPPHAARALPAAIARPRIEVYGCADDPRSKEVPVAGEHAALSLVVSGLVREEIDANSLVVEINGEESLPYYVGPVRRECEAVLSAEQRAALDCLTQVQVAIPIGEPSGPVRVSVRVSSDEASEPVIVELRELQPVIPNITAVMNASNLGTEIYARGGTPAIRLYVEGLDETADPGNVRLQVGERIIKPGTICPSPRRGVYQVDAQLPQDLAPGVTDLRLYFGNLQSPSLPLRLK
jgi:ubiquinone/menaquinone biosynthesis C-methylase UbiE